MYDTNLIRYNFWKMCCLLGMAPLLSILEYIQNIFTWGNFSLSNGTTAFLQTDKDLTAVMNINKEYFQENSEMTFNKH